MTRFPDYFFAARPLLQLPIWTVYLITLHSYHEATGESFGWTNLLVMAGVSLLFTGAVYLNSVYDQESDRINNKVGFLQRGFLSRTQLLTGFVMVSIVPMAYAPFISPFMMFLFAQFLFLSYIYSAPPLRLKDRPILGLIANAYGHGFLVSLTVLPDFSIHTAGRYDWHAPIYFSLTVGATYLMTTIPDLDGDAATGKRTLAVALGRVGACLVALVLLVASVFVAYAADLAVLVYLSILAVFLVLASLLLRTEASIRFASKMPLLALTLVAGYYYPAYFLFVVALLVATRAYYLRRFGVVYPELA